MASSRYGVDRLREQALFNNMGNIDINDPYGGINQVPQEVAPLRSRPPVDMSNDPYGGINEAPPPQLGPDLNVGTNQPSGDIPNLRIQNIAPPSAPSYVDPYEEAKQLMDLQSRLYTPQTTQSDRYNKILDEFPEYEKPSFARKLTSAMLGIKGGIDVQDKVLHGPYARALAEWKAEEEPLRQSATLENQQNTQERTLAGNVISNVAANRRVTQQEEAAKAATGIAQQRVDVERARVAALDFKAHNPNWTFDAHSGPFVIAMNPADGTSHSTGVPTGNMPEIERINWETQGKIAVAEATGAQDRQTQAAPRTAPGQTAPGVFAPGIGPNGQPVNQLEVSRGRQNRLEQAAVYGPWAKFVKKVGSDYQPVEPTAGFLGWGTVPPQEKAEYENFIKYVYEIPDKIGGGQQQAAPPPPARSATPQQGVLPPPTEMIGGPVQGPPELKEFTPGGAWAQPGGKPAPQEPWFVTKGKEMMQPPPNTGAPSVYGGGGYGGELVPPKGPQQPQRTPQQQQIDTDIAAGRALRAWDMSTNPPREGAVDNTPEGRAYADAHGLMIEGR